MSKSKVSKVQIENKEVWKDVVGYKGYYRVSSFGRIWSVARVVKRPYGKGGDMKIISCPIKGRIMKFGTSDRYGHRYVVLNKGAGPRNHSVHHLVLGAFVGPKPMGMEGCHNNGDPTNNRLTNLRWDTHRNNHADRFRHGTNNAGERNGSAKLTKIEVKRIRALYAEGNLTMQRLSCMYGVAESTIMNITTYQSWRW